MKLILMCGPLKNVYKIKETKDFKTIKIKGKVYTIPDFDIQ